MKIKGLKFKGGSEKIWSILVFFARNIILSCLLVVFISFIFGAFIFYSNVVLIGQGSLESMDSSLDIKKNYYDLILKKWEDEEKRIEGIESKNYANIFYSPPKAATSE